MSHQLETATRVGAHFIFRHKSAETHIGATANSTAKLMQLRQAEALGAVNDHYRGIRHIHAYLNHRGGNENLSLAACKKLHLIIFLGRFHLTVNVSYAVFGTKNLLYGAITLLNAAQVNLFILFYQRIDNVSLLSEAQPACHQTPYLLLFLLIIESSGDWLAARRKLVNDRHIEVAVERHCQCARYGSGGHHQHVRRCGVFAPHTSPLSHAETVLLVDDGHAKVFELDSIFNQSVSAHKNLH